MSAMNPIVRQCTKLTHVRTVRNTHLLLTDKKGNRKKNKEGEQRILETEETIQTTMQRNLPLFLRLPLHLFIRDSYHVTDGDFDS